MNELAAQIFAALIAQYGVERVKVDPMECYQLAALFETIREVHETSTQLETVQA